MRYKKKNFATHGETDLKESWYWNVLLKNMGDWQKAKEAIHQSKLNTDPLYILEYLIRQ